MASTERLKSYLDQYPFVAVAYVEKQEGQVFDSLLEAGSQFTIQFTIQFTRFTRTKVQILTPEELLKYSIAFSKQVLSLLFSLRCSLPDLPGQKYKY